MPYILDIMVEKAVTSMLKCPKTRTIIVAIGETLAKETSGETRLRQRKLGFPLYAKLGQA